MRQTFGGRVARVILECHLLGERRDQRPVHQMALVASLAVNNRQDVTPIRADVVRAARTGNLVVEFSTNLGFGELKRAADTVKRSVLSRIRWVSR